MDAKVLFEKAIEEATACLKCVHDDQLGNDTPCSEWDLRTLINHLVYETSWVPDLLAGKTVQEVGDRYDGDLLGDDFVGAWHKASEAALKAVARADHKAVVHLSYGDVSTDHYIAEMGGDVLIHTWDVAQSINCSLVLDKKAVETVYHNTLPRKDEFAASGLFGKVVKVSDSAPVQTKLLALVGRKEKTRA